MRDLVFVTSPNCELCRKARLKVNFLNTFYNIIEKDVEDGYQEYLLRIPVLLREQNILDEGIFSRIKVLRNLIKYR
jgi:hypothetical protein